MSETFRTELTEAGKSEYANEHIAAMERGEGVLICPWCSKINRPDLPVCCGFMQEARTKRGQDQFQSVINQLREVKRGNQRSIHCPYCGAWNKRIEADTHPSEWIRPMVSPFCCDVLHDAATAIAERAMMERLTEDKKKIEDQMAANN